MVTSVPKRKNDKSRSSALAGPPVNPDFAKALNELVTAAKKGQRTNSEFFNPEDKWLVGHMRIFQDLSLGERERLLHEWRQISEEAKEANAAGKAAVRAGPDVVLRLDSSGIASFSQLGVARRPDLTQYFIDGFARNRDAIAFSEANQALFSEILPYVTRFMKQHFASGDTIIQTDRQIGDSPKRSFHARQLLFCSHYLQLPYMWRRLTFEIPAAERSNEPDILEVSIPHWLDDLGIPDSLKGRIREAGLMQLVFKAPTLGLSLHLGFDYMGEHKMGPLTIAMFKVKQAQGLAVQAALSVARVRTLDGTKKNTALVTLGPSLHGKSTLTIMIEVEKSELSKLLALPEDPEEGVYPMNDDIVLLQRLPKPVEVVRDGKHIQIFYSIDGTENDFYAVPFGLTREDDPITYEVVRGAENAANPQETLENTPCDPTSGKPDFLNNPVRNMRMVLPRLRLISRKGSQHVLQGITKTALDNSVHVPMENIDRVFWQGVMRQNTIVPPLVRLTLEQYVRALMYGEAVQMGAAAGAIGRPYVEYFSDPFIIGLEDDNASLMYAILQQIARGGLAQEYYMFNTGGVGADTNEQASGPRYKKIPREVTLMLQEALLRGAMKFDNDPVLGMEVAVAIVDVHGKEVLDIRKEWLPREIYGEPEYAKRVQELKRRRYYGKQAEDKAGILRYTKVTDALFDLNDIPTPDNERELAWLLSFFWHLDQAYNSLEEVVLHSGEGKRPSPQQLRGLQQKYKGGLTKDSNYQKLVSAH
ncbi:MAG: phosphoenolpyruvate carboxykinase (ATP) [Chloroflexi bacterium]|nr:phosphoenolpyruvate carboxykinase (ATP) [Chloroflexota bacterium]